MKFRLIILICCCLTLISDGQPRNQEYILNIVFYPSFISSSKLTIEAEADSASIALAVFEKQTKRALIAKSDIELLTNFLKSYKYEIRGSIDTIGIHKGLKGDTSTYYEISMGTDGIDVEGDFNKNNIIKKFAFWSPKKGSENQKLIEILFRITNDSFDDEITTSYINQLKEYF